MRQGVMAHPEVRDTWGGPRAQKYVALTLRTFGPICALCGLPGANSADHIIPISKGGAVYVLDNLQPAHRSCNYGRGNRPATSYQHIEDGTAWFQKD